MSQDVLCKLGSIDLDFEHLQRVCLGKSYFNYYKQMSQPLRMSVKTHLSSTDPIIEPRTG